MPRGWKVRAMIESSLRFSLRSVFVAITLIGSVIAACAHYPIVLVIWFILVSPLFFIAAAVHRHNQAGRR
jgi:hypothetical protein